MDNWARVKWTEGRQVLQQLDASALGDDPSPTLPPSAYFAGLRTLGRLDRAADFLGQSLPRYEAVAWAARTVRDLAATERGSPEAQALKTALLWVQDPTEARRRAAGDAAGAAEIGSPERYAALAAFMSGGSLSMEGLEPVPAPRNAAGVMAAGAVRATASLTADRRAALQQALDAGAAIAAGADPNDRAAEDDAA